MTVPPREDEAPPADDGRAAELRAVAERYARRRAAAVDSRYDPLRPEVWRARQERERALVALLRAHAARPLAQHDVLEIGCGHGDNLLELLRLGCDPKRLVANELLPERAAAARSRLPAVLRLYEGDAAALPFAPASFDIVLQSMVFSSLLDPAFQARLAARLWDWVRPGGAVLWYDFTVDNPANPDVRGVSRRRLRELFPAATIDARRVTLAPPLARRAAALAPWLCDLLGTLPPLRTHLLAWIAKPPAQT